VAYGDDPSPTDMREIPFGRDSTVPPILSQLSDIPGNLLAKIRTERDPLLSTANPDPHEERPRSTKLIVIDPPPRGHEASYKIHLGCAFASLSDDKFSPAFIGHMQEFDCDLPLSRLRTEMIRCCWDAQFETSMR
jgi:hypothetical protein